MLASLSVPVEVDIALHNGDKTELTGIRCGRMRWIGAAADIESAVREVCETVGHRIDVVGFKARLAARIADYLLREQIEIIPEIELHVEAREADALDRLVDDADQLCCVTKYEQYVKNRSTTFSPSEVELLDEQIVFEFHPDPTKRRLSVRGRLLTPNNRSG